MGKIKNHGIPASAKDFMRHFGKDAFRLNAHEKKFIREQGFDTEYLFIETKEQRAAQKGWCSHCRKWVTLPVYTPERLAHKEKVKCPNCGCELTVQHAWRMRKDLYDEALVYFYRPSVLNPEIVTARAVSVVRLWGRKFRPAPTKMIPDVRVDSFYVYEPGVGGKMLRPTNKMRIYWAESTAIEYGGNVYEWARAPHLRNTTYIMSSYGFYERDWVKVSADTEEAFRAAAKSPLRYGMEEYWSSPDAQDGFLVYWHWAARYSSVEKLVKIGLSDMIANKMMGKSTGNYINWRGKDLASILRGRLTKADKAFLRDGTGGAAGINELAVWQLFGGKTSIEEIVRNRCGIRWGFYLDRWKKIKKRVGDLEKAARYLDKQKKSPDLYDDYLSECEKLGYDMTAKATLYPKDLWAAHEHTREQIKYQESQALETEYKKKRRPAMKRKYEWAAMGMMVVVPERVSDLIAEGEKQHNCVGGYMERVATGRTDVVFIRKDTAPEKPYITMEIHDGKIIQARTKNNGPLDKLGKEFVNAFRAAKLEKKKKAKARKTA